MPLKVAESALGYFWVHDLSTWKSNAATSVDVKYFQNKPLINTSYFNKLGGGRFTENGKDKSLPYNPHPL